MSNGDDRNGGDEEVVDLSEEWEVDGQPEVTFEGDAVRVRVRFRSKKRRDEKAMFEFLHRPL